MIFEGIRGPAQVTLNSQNPKEIEAQRSTPRSPQNCPEGIFQIVARSKRAGEEGSSLTDLRRQRLNSEMTKKMGFEEQNVGAKRNLRESAPKSAPKFSSNCWSTSEW